MANVKSSLLLLILILNVLNALETPCGEWLPYKDEKCIKVFTESMKTHEEAEKLCFQFENGASLLTIHSQDEQEFIETYLFQTSKTVNDVWIGLKSNQTEYNWVDNSNISYTNWVSGTPQVNAAKPCVQMSSDTSSLGKWLTEPCERKNLFVCQKPQTWSLAYLQQIFINTRKELSVLKAENNQLKNTVINLTNEFKLEQTAILELQSNPIPIGFVYVQFGNQSEPKAIWPHVNWSDASSEYAGLFFRAIGGDSANFNTIQAQNFPTLGVNHFCCVEQDTLSSVDPLTVPTNGDYSQYIMTGSDRGSYHIFTRFKYTTDELRPRNQAIRIWKRIN